MDANQPLRSARLRVGGRPLRAAKQACEVHVNPPSSEVRSLAEQLLEHETGPRPGVRQMILGAEVVCRKIAASLEPAVGSTGFPLILTRALHHASVESPLLERVRTGTASGGWLEGFGARVHAREPEEVRDAITAVLACSLRLLGRCFGDDLAVRIVSRAWPDVPPARTASAFREAEPRGNGDQLGSTAQH